MAIRETTGFGPRPIADLLNESMRRSGKDRKVWASTVYNVLVRERLIEKEECIQKRWKRFEWGRPGQLVQADLTPFNGVNILTLEDDHSRKAWSLALPDARDDTVIGGMRALLTKRYDNLLTDNGCQFSRSNKLMREYCEEMLRGKHIWASSHYPQTLGKLGAYQKALKRFLTHRLDGCRDVAGINVEIDLYNDYYNNLRHHSGIGAVPESRYSNDVDRRSYDRFVRNMNLEGILAL